MTAATQALSDTTARPAARAQLNPRTRLLLEGPITATLLKLAAPNVLVMIVQASIGLIETYFIGMLGTDALAGVALVFPVMMLMQMMSAGAMGGGISSAIARALGARRTHEADALTVHAIVIALMFGVVFTLAVLGGGQWLYAALGGAGPSLSAALTYSSVVFGGAILVWLFNSLSNVIRGTGNMAVPAVITCAGAVVLIPLSPCLIFGWGPFPRLGIAGGAWAVVTYYGVGTIALALYLWSGRGVVRPLLHDIGFRWALFRDILRVGAVAALITVQTNFTIAFATGLVGQFGPAAIAGYGTGSRLEYLLIPLVFGLGGPLVAMVGTNIGAGQPERALRAAWIGAAIATALTEMIGLTAALFPHAWLTLFDTDPVMLEAGTRYLQAVGPVYGLFGLGMALYFSSQGAGRLLWPLLANFARLVIAAGGGWLALKWGGGLFGVFLMQGMGLAAFGLINAGAIAMGAWGGEKLHGRRCALLENRGIEMSTKTPQIACLSNGPYYLINDPTQRVVPNIQKSNGEPCATVTGVALCRCGGSNNKPFCDGTHIKNGFTDKKLTDGTLNKRVNYVGKNITIHDNRGICSHAGYCSDNLSSVFRLKAEPWIDPDGATAREIIDTVKKCPSGALSYSVDHVEHRDQDRAPMVTVSKDGPFAITGGVTLIDQQSGEGASSEHYTLCRCGGSKNKPFCDGTHWNIGFKDEKN